MAQSQTSVSRPWWQQLADQVRGNARLRLGLWCALGLVWLYVLLWSGDWIDARQAQTQALQEQAQRLRPMRQPAAWKAREDEARDELARLRTLAWRGPDRGLVEANLQDWVRSVVAKSGLGLRDLRLMAEDPAAAPRAGASAPPATPVRLHVVLDFQRVQALGLMAELARHEPIVAVERMTVRSSIQPPTMELDLRALVWLGEAN